MRNFGGIIKNSLITTFEQNDDDEDQAPTYRQSKFIEADKLCNFMKSKGTWSSTKNNYFVWRPLSDSRFF